MKAILIVTVALSWVAIVGLGSATPEKSDCKVQADYARYVADERDRGVPMKEVMARVSGTDPEKVWARMTVGNIYGNKLVTAQRVEELYLVRCEP